MAGVNIENRSVAAGQKTGGAKVLEKKRSQNCGLSVGRCKTRENEIRKQSLWLWPITKKKK